jgi:hypothetical protein
MIFVSHSRIKYIDNLKWLTKITNDWHFEHPFLLVDHHPMWRIAFIYILMWLSNKLIIAYTKSIEKVDNTTCKIGLLSNPVLLRKGKHYVRPFLVSIINTTKLTYKWYAIVSWEGGRDRLFDNQGDRACPVQRRCTRGWTILLLSMWGSPSCPFACRHAAI